MLVIELGDADTEPDIFGRGGSGCGVSPPPSHLPWVLGLVALGLRRRR